MYSWMYVWTDESGWKRVRANAPLEHLRGDIALPRCRDGFVRFGQVAGHTESREPLDVLFVDFTKHAANAHGFMTEKQRRSSMVSGMELFEAHSALTPSRAHAPTVIDAAKLFARRRYDAKHRWRPSRGALEEFCRLVNSRAGRELLALTPRSSS